MKKIPLLSLALLVTNTSLQAQTIAVDTDIQEVLVSASLVPIAVSRSGNAVTIIDREQLKNRAAISLSNILRDVPGFSVSQVGVLGSQTQVRVRGAEANHLLVTDHLLQRHPP